MKAAKFKKNKNQRQLGQGYAKVEISKGECFLDSDTDVMGIQIHFAGRAIITPSLPKDWIMQGNNNVMIMFTLSNRPIQKELLFKYNGSIKITKLIVSDKNGLRLPGSAPRKNIDWKTQRLNIDSETETWDNIKDKNKTATVKRTSYNLPNYNLPKIDKTRKTKKVKEILQKIRNGGY